MTYDIGKIGQVFLGVMKIEYGDHFFAPDAIFDNLSSRDQKRFEISVFNPNFYSRAAAEIMEKIFSPAEQERLKQLIIELGNKDNVLAAKASSEISNIIKEYKNNSISRYNYTEEFIKSEDDKKKWLTGIVCGVFEQIPPSALNLLGLMKIQPEYFSQSYHFFEQMLENFSKSGRIYYQAEIKKHFSKAVEGLEKLVEDIKSKKQPTEPSPSFQPEPTPNQTPQPEREKDTPVNSNENSETPNNSENDSKHDQIPNETNEPSSPNLEELQNLKDQVISEITTALNQTPPLTNSDLSSKYQDWEDKINDLSDERQINFLKDGILVNIQSQRKEKVKKQTARETGEIINDNLQKAQNPDATIQEKEEALANSEQYEGQPTYEDRNTKEKIKNLKKEVARDNPPKYRNKIISDLNTKLKNNRLNRKELDNETQDLIKALEGQKISDPSQLVETEIKITQKIGQQGAAKRIRKIKKKAKVFLKSNNKAGIDELKKQLTEFIKSNNVYYQTQKSKAQQLLKQLESGLINNSHSSLPFSVQIGIGTGAVLVVLFFTILIWKKEKSRWTIFESPN